MDDQNKNLILAIVLSGLVILGWITFFPPEPVVPPQTTQETASQTPSASGDIAAVPQVAGSAATTPALTAGVQETRDAALAKTARVLIETPRLKGSLSLTGARIVIDRRNVLSRRPSKTSPMPPALLDRLTLPQILDLIALLESRGDPAYPAFR